MGKLPWLEGQAEPAWPASEHAPTGVTFYSFKGGVGRTSTLASCAIQAAQQGERVVVIDLDLEAPGIGTLFGPIFGAGLVVSLQNYLATSDFPVTIITGVVFMVCVLVFRRGLVGEFFASRIGRKLGFRAQN